MGGPAKIEKRWGDLFILGGPKNISLWGDLLFRSIFVLCNDKAFCDSEIPFSLFPFLPSLVLYMIVGGGGP